MKRHAWLLALLLPWPFALHQLSSRVCTNAEALGFAFGALQRTAPEPTFPVLGPAADPSSAQQPQFEQLAGDAPVFNEGAGGTRASDKAATKRKSRVANHAPDSKAPAPKLGIRVPAHTVLRLANARAVPQGSYVPAAAGRPAGMQLLGVSGFGVGLRDGDVLTQVAGAPATSRSQVVSAVLQARAARAPAISAVFWRDGEPWRLLVEMPYLRGS